jgi:hypothetical protein
MRGWTWASSAFSKGLNELTTHKTLIETAILWRRMDAFVSDPGRGELGLSDLSERKAVLQAMAEYDQLGRDAFLARYGYGPARSYLIVHNGTRYDSKAVAGVAVGKQFPASGPLTATDFSGGEATVKAKLEQLGFEVVGPSDGQPAEITARDVQLVRESRSKPRYSEITADERTAYEHISAALATLGSLAVTTLGDRSRYQVRLTSGFHLASGVRGSRPKDLWWGASRLAETSGCGN